jgi:hypothetical protein
MIILVSKTPYLHLEFKRIISFLKPTKYKFESLPFKKLKIGIITAENRNEKYIELHDKSVSEYCNIHNYDYIRTDNCPKEEASTYWCKIHKIKNELVNYDYVIWLDSDTIIVNKSIPVEECLSKFGYPDIVFGKNSVPFDIGRYSINAGVIIIKNSEIGKSFINKCLDKINSLPSCIIDNKEQGFWVGICYEEGLMNIIVKSKLFENHVFIDTDNTFILNLLRTEQVGKNLIFLHLPGWSNKERENVFNEYMKYLK